MNKNNNKGFTLLEVLVAMAILGIVVAPSLHAFITAAKTNAKARDLLNANIVAENFMEELKVTPIEQLKEDELEDEEDDGSRHHFSVQRTQDGIKYDLQVSAEPKYSQVAEIHSMNEPTCGYYVQPNTLDDKAAAEFYRRHIAFTMDTEDEETLASYMSRTIDIVIEQDGLENTKASVVYTYTMPNTYVSDTKYSVRVNLYDEATASEELEALYVYFSPFVIGKSDTINIRNNEAGANSIATTLYLVRMDGTGKVPTLNLYDSGSNGVSITKICSNMAKDDYTAGMGNSLMKFLDLAGTKTVLTSYDLEIAVYKKGNRIQIYTGSVRITDQ